jgi:hypothetical protein
MIRATFSTRQQQKIDQIVREIMFIKTYDITNDSHGYLLLGQQCYAYHPSHTHVRAVANCLFIYLYSLLFYPMRILGLKGLLQ